eukprot:3519779-Rhodomonas_salina.1
MVAGFRATPSTAAVTDRIQRHLSNADDERRGNGALVVYGDQGSGKTSIMADSVITAVTSSTPGEDGGRVVVARFLGQSGQSSCEMVLIRGLCKQLSRVYRPDASEAVEDVE